MNAHIRLPALLYHHVGPRWPGTHAALTISHETFQSQIRLLAQRGFRGVSTSDWLAWLSERRPLPRRPVLLTFDDGYADLAEYALPTLERIGWPATVFVASAAMGGVSAWDETEAATHRLLSSDQIRTWATRGIEFGAHGETHCDLTQVERKRLHQEVVGSRDALTELVGARVKAFAYPYGRHNDEVRRLVADSFELAFGVEEGLNGRETDRMRHRRTMVQGSDTGIDVILRARLGWSPLERVRACARVRDRARRLSGRQTSTRS